VTRDLLRATRIVMPATLAFAVVLAFAPGRAEIAVRVYALVLCGLALLLAISSLRRAYPPATPLRRPSSDPRGVPTRPTSLTRLEDVVALGMASAFDFHRRLRPRLRAIASGLLATRRGISLDEAPERSRQILGDETHDLVRRERPLPEDRLARGLPLEDLSRAVDSLERI
jgi:hypothetical protein